MCQEEVSTGGSKKVKGLQLTLRCAAVAGEPHKKGPSRDFSIIELLSKDSYSSLCIWLSVYSLHIISLYLLLFLNPKIREFFVYKRQVCLTKWYMKTKQYYLPVHLFPNFKLVSELKWPTPCLPEAPMVLNLRNLTIHHWINFFIKLQIQSSSKEIIYYGRRLPYPYFKATNSKVISLIRTPALQCFFPSLVIARH